MVRAAVLRTRERCEPQGVGLASGRHGEWSINIREAQNTSQCGSEASFSTQRARYQY